LIDELANLGKLSISRNLASFPAATILEWRRSGRHYPAAELRIEAAAQFEQGGYPPRPSPGVGRMKNPGDDLKQRAFPGAIFTDDAKCFARCDFETNFLEC